MTRYPSADDRERSAGPGRAHEQGSLPAAMLFTFVSLAVVALLLPVLLTQVRQTRQMDRRTASLAIALSGLDLAVARVRATGGDTTRLPCAPLAHHGTRPVSVRMVYFSEDPAGRSDAWLSANGVSCPGATVPRFARFTATDQSEGGRSLSAVYTFRSLDVILGGQVRTMQDGVTPTVDRCFDAGSGNPPDGTPVLMQDCTAGGSLGQNFAYTGSLTLVLVASRTASRPNGLCVEAAAAAAAAAQLRPCQSPAIPAQRFSINTHSNFVATSDGATANGYCLASSWENSPGSAPGSPVVNRADCGITGTTSKLFAIDAGVGAGAADASTRQLVNFGQPGRCLDITDNDVTQPYLLAWQCKQSFTSPAGLDWNQTWSAPAPGSSGTLSVRNASDDRDYCLRSPGAVYDATVPGPYVTVTPCPPTVTAGSGLTWTVTRDTGRYATSYTIRNADGYCLAANDRGGSDNWHKGDRVAKIATVTCTDSPLQKWNAPADLTQRPLRDYREH